MPAKPAPTATPAPAPPAPQTVAGLIVGIMSVVLGWVPFIGFLMIPAGAIALVLGILARRRGAPLARATIIVGIVGLVLALASSAFWVWAALFGIEGHRTS